MENRLSLLETRLRAWGLNGLAAAALESAGPLAFVGAQALYVFSPALSVFDLQDDVTALARLLEDTEAVRRMAQRLGEENA